MVRPKLSPTAIITRLRVLARITPSPPETSPCRPLIQPVSTPPLTCVVPCIWPAVQAAVCPTVQPGGVHWERITGALCITDTTTALETRQRSWVTAVASSTTAAFRLWPVPSTCTTDHKRSFKETITLCQTQTLLEISRSPVCLNFPDSQSTQFHHNRKKMFRCSICVWAQLWLVLWGRDFKELLRIELGHI